MKYIFTQAELNLRQRRCIELVGDYDLYITYHPSKANCVADALSRKRAASAQEHVMESLESDVGLVNASKGAGSEYKVYANGTILVHGQVRLTRDVASWVVRYDTCKLVKAEHQVVGGLL
ncbi:PREDICTED: uncharacterized protein LOC109126433 [Camelina sativa]|uniref:Uncharacterized protein LOC109126433 n=1 Tax=Camelina sativa TaxID=90675 RepID=A0ABM1QFH5_CAMSA|nr:PREDICTED: uncharacterized protein LOC109126433 [Camelina sativa]